MTNTDLQRLAEGATKRLEVRPTNWPTESLFVIGDQETTGRGLQMLTADALFHAAASPTRILSLLQEIERLRKVANEARILHKLDVMNNPLCNSDLRGLNDAFDEYDRPQPPTPGSAT